LTGKRNAEIASQSGFHSLFSVSQRDANVSHLLRPRATRETQTGTHLLLEEGRIEEVPSPTPSHGFEANEAKDSPDEDGPDADLRWARIKFTGVMNDMCDHMFDTSRPPNPRFEDGAAEWEKFGLNSLAVERVAWRGEVPVLVLSANDPAAARRGLEKYHRKWDASLRKRFDCEVWVELQQAQR
jgi:hypothetical protein